jgi:8-oxo-dGTP pyrophosphatase MutT (NUDIX family)
MGDGVVGAAHRVAYRVAWFGLRGWWRIVHPVSVGVRIMLTDGERILLVRHTYREGWFMPGGGVHRHEMLVSAARREAFEETGVRLRDVRLLGIYASFGESKSDHVALFVCTEFGPVGDHDQEIAEVAWFPFGSLPTGVSPGTAERIAEFGSGATGLVGRW